MGKTVTKKKRSKSSLKHPVQGLPDISLTQRQRKLADIMVDGVADEDGVTKPVTVTKAAQIAGYAKGESGRTVASRTLRLPHVQAYLFQRVAEGIGLSAISAGHVVHRLALTAKSEYVRLEASKDILDRSGFKAPDKVQHQHEVAITIDLG
jgi:hypothetical protein